MKDEDILKDTKDPPGQVVIVLDRSTVAIEEEALVHPIGDEEVKPCHWVHNGHSTRIEKRHSEHGKHVCVSKLHHELVTSVQTLIVLLDELTSPPLIACAASIAATLATIGALNGDVGQVWTEDHQQKSDHQG